ncbi:MAG: GNAT family N-acetyltransferase [Bacteroidaceae bacterium]|nr:GNAT family N-acetyltransferase [Bacteroidaceae bacterium]
MNKEQQPRFHFNTIGLFTTDNAKMVAFYHDIFGFSTNWNGKEPNVEMNLGNMHLIMFPRTDFEEMISQKFNYQTGKNGTMELSFDVPTFNDVDKEYDRALSMGAKPIMEPTTESWGQRTCYVADPEGNLIEISSFNKQTTMNIRLEQLADYREVEILTREAFWNVYAPGCVEHYVLNQYRSNPDFIPELDFVMEEEGKIIGHVMFSKAEIIKEDGSVFPAWTFGPISIHPEYKRKGYGLKLLQYALEKARKMGIGVICMEGNIEFYKHAGFVVASTLGIHYHAEPKDAEVPYFLAQELIPGYLNGIEGTYHTPKGYYVAFENKEAFEAYEATFPKKEKKQHEGQLVDDCTINPNEK